MTHKRTTLIAGIALAIAVLSVAAYGGTLFVVETHKDTLSERQIEQARVKANHASLASLARTVEESQAEREELSSRILKESEVIELLSLIEAIGREQGILLTTESLTAEPYTENFEHLRIRLDAEGTYSGIMHVLRMLETLPYQSSLDSISITTGLGEVAEWTATLELVVTKYVNALP